ncbi:MAG: hypothetical protein ACE5H2_07115 [Terriglobia bacterium]
MSIVKSFAVGWGKVVKSPAVICWVYLASVVLALPLALAMRAILKESIGASLVQENLRQGFDLAWYGEFSAATSGLGETFGPSVVGILPILSNLEKLLEGNILRTDATILLAGVLFLLAWAFFAGGILDRYARPEEVQSRARLFSQGAEYFFRFVRLLIISLLLYWGIFRWVANPLHRWMEQATRDVTVETTVMVWRLGVYAVAGFLLILASMALDYAKIAMVVERRRSASLAFLRGLRFVSAHPGKTFGLYLLLLAVGLVLLYGYSLVAPGPGQSSWATILLAFLIGQAYLLARLVLKLWFLGSQTVLFQSAQPLAWVTPEPAPSLEP